MGPAVFRCPRASAGSSPGARLRSDTVVEVLNRPPVLDRNQRRRRAQVRT